MRNLKKFLALMLAMIMAMSLMITANATSTAEDFADSTGITPEFAEAVDVLSGMRVFSGDNGNFKPAANITRAEMAAVIYRLVSGDVTDAKAGLYSNYSPFKDVTADKWYAGYVGYCWNMGLIKGRDANTFDPTGNVTGYEALAMLLRAVGYDKNGEFTGPTWQTNVSTQGQQLGILRDIATTQYGGTLHLPARRDVIASMTFRTAAYVPTVTYSPAMGYNQYVGLPVTGGAGTTNVAPQFNPTLGWKAFGLTRDTGIVVGNQDTGESVTRMSFSLNRTINDAPAEDVYAYGLVDNGFEDVAAGDNDQINAIVTFDAKTGLDLFAHRTEIWFDGRQTELNLAGFGLDVPIDWRNSKQLNNLHTYAYFDRATHTDVVKLADANKTNLTVNTTTGTTLGGAASAAGFTVNGGTRVVQNKAFDRFLALDAANVANRNTVDTVTIQAPDTATARPEFENLYLLISNSANKELDVVIALNIQVSEITGVDNVNAIKTVTLPQVTTVPEFIAPDNEISTNNAATIEQGQLVSGSTTTLGQYEIGVHVDGTAPIQTLPTGAYVGTAAVWSAGDQLNAGVAPGYTPSYPSASATVLTEDAWFKLVPVTNTKDGTVVSYNPNTGKVVLQDGTVLDRSILYNSVVPGTIPQVGATETYQNANYRFYLTPEGKYLGAEQIYGNTFLYGTYMDYQTVTSSSTFEYYLTGVKLDGTVDTVRVVTLNGAPINGTDALGVPFRDTYGTSSVVTPNTNAINGLGTGVYRGFVIGGTGANWNFVSMDNIGVIAGDNVTGNTWDGTTGPVYNNVEPEVNFNGDDANQGSNDPISIGSTQLALGAAYAGEITMTNGADTQQLYFTENTKFIVVSGFGTDSLKPQVFNGLTALVGSSRSVSIDLDLAVNNTTAITPGTDVRMAGIDDNIKLSQMTYMTQSPFVYAQNQVLSRQADVIILPATAISRTESTTLRYVGDSTLTLVNANDNATQFTMYNNGVAESVWINGMVNAGVTNDLVANDDTTNQGVNSADAINDTGHDHFYRLLDTGRTANDGKPIYSVALANVAYTQNIYTASTMNAQTGNFECTLSVTNSGRTPGDKNMLRVDSANITNLNVLNAGGNVWPGINSLTTLNYAGSLGNYTGGNEHGGTDTLYVSAIVDNLTVQQIYVCYDQHITP